MHEKTFYSCDICGTDYAKKEDAEECEQNHKLLSEAEIVQSSPNLCVNCS